MSAIWSGEYRARKGDVDLFMYRKRATAPDASPDRLPVFFMVHGSSFSGPSGFDLTVPGRDDYSFMDHFARLGFDVWTMDHEGYGRSSKTESNSDLASGVEDLRAGMAIVQKETGRDSYAFYGQSSGALRLAGFAAKYGRFVERAVLDAFVWTGKDAPTLIKRRENLDFFRTHSTRPVDKAFYNSIFTRDQPGTSEPMVGDALADAELRWCDAVPTGTYLDMCQNLPTVDPADIDCPVLITRGEHDGIATEEDLIEFFKLLPNKDKHFSILPGQAHVAPLGINRHRFYHVVHGFLTMPNRADV